ncbi:hypothetical protein DJ030_12725 [bacterium endosymbiont of Escarpia laminata]|nr:MAG: hypothetical protein DJ031_12280 [bacterium endosymbiont of Escarpia laminata]RLJ18243.1 MAG: hypothetical protein DJ030_12725 [bacterium endosymbiont of Escarpia laminata]
MSNDKNITNMPYAKLIKKDEPSKEQQDRPSQEKDVGIQIAEKLIEGIDEIRKYNKECRRSQRLDESPYPFYEKHITEYANYDTWAIEEAINLLLYRHANCHLLDENHTTLKKIIDRSVGPGGTLQTHETGSFLNKKRLVKPSNLIHWAQQKGIKIPNPLLREFHPSGLTIESPTTKATQKRIRDKQERHHALREFIHDIEGRTKQLNRNWSIDNLPVTKNQFHEVFYKRYPRVKKVAAVTLSDELPKLGVRFSPGRRSKNFNQLESLFCDEIKGK